eukprot:1118356_1
MAQQISPGNPLQVRSLEKWKRVFQDELDMAENEEFLVLKTSMCGWWYAINKKQEDGLIPYMYLEILGNYVDYTEITQHEFSHIERTVLGWDIHNVCKLVFQDQKSTTQEQNILLHSLRNLYIMCQKQDCRYTFLSKGGLDRLHNILQNTYDIAIRTFCLRALILLAPSIEARRFPAQGNLTEGILVVMKEYIDMPSFVCICTDALSNVAFQNERQRMLASQTNAVEMLLYSMERHQSVFKVQLQASRSLANMASDPKIQRQIDDKGVQTLLNGLNAVFSQGAVNSAVANQYGQDQQHAAAQNQQQQHGALFDAKKGQFAQQMLVILSYLVTDPRKARSFGQLGGWQCLKTIQNSIGVWDEAVRATIVGMLNGMSQNPAIARCFFDNNYEAYDMLFDLALDAEPYSLYFYQIFSIICFISCKCDKQQLPEVIIHAFDQKQLARLMNDALQQRDNERLMDTVPTLCALTARTKHPQACQYVFNSMVPMHLLKIIGTPPGPPNDQFLNYTMITIYNLSDDESRIDPFIQNGAIEAIAMNNFYEDPMKDEFITQNGIAALVNICSKTNRKLLPQQEQAIQHMIQACFQVHPKLKPIIQKLDIALKKAQQGSGKKKKRNARNKGGKRNARNQPQQGGNAPQGSYDPKSGSYQGQNNAQKPRGYQENQGQQQQGGYGGGPQQGGGSNFNGPVQSGLVEMPSHDEDRGSMAQSQYSNNPRNNYNPYQSQQNMGGGPPQQQQQNYGGNPNQNPYQSQSNFNNNMGGPPQQQQGGFGGGAPPQQGGFGGNPNNQNPYQSQQNFGNQPPQNQGFQNVGPPPSGQQPNQGMSGNDKWANDDSDDGGGPQDDSSSEDEWEKQKNAKINAASQVGFQGNNPAPVQQQQQQQPQQQQYGAPPQGGNMQNSAWNDDSSDDDVQQGNNNQGWGGAPPNQQQPPQQQQYQQQNPSGMSKQSIAQWNNQDVAQRDYIGYNPQGGGGGGGPPPDQGGYGGGGAPQQQQMPPQQQQQQQAPKKKKKKKFKLFGK